MQRIAFGAVLGAMLVGGSAALAQTPTWTPPPESARDEARRQMPVVLLDHPRVGVPEVLRHYQQRRAVHDGKTGPGMAQDMETDRRFDLAVRACLCHWPCLFRLLPRAAVAVTKYQFMPTADCPNSTWRYYRRPHRCVI